MKNITAKPDPLMVVQRLCESGAAPLSIPPVTLVLAHPDDEVIGAGSRLSRLAGNARLVYLTDGAPRNMRDAMAAGCATREDYAGARIRELSAVMDLAGIPLEDTLHLNIVDQEASLYLVPLAFALAEHFVHLRPSVVITHPYEGGHPDHDAAAFGVQAACRLMWAQGLQPPLRIEMTSYHRGPRGIQPGVFLPEGGVVEGTITLSPEERRLKKRMLECYVTQRETLRWFPTETERFRPAPDYDFTRPPHAGKLFYEDYDWGMDGARWRELVRTALREMEPC